MVYQREPHARQLAFRDVAQPETFEERAELVEPGTWTPENRAYMEMILGL